LTHASLKAPPWPSSSPSSGLAGSHRMATEARGAASASSAAQGLTLGHFSAQRKRFL
jgi:hypothetical protein